MKLAALIQSLGANLAGRKAGEVAPPVLTDPIRFPYGPFKFRTVLPRATGYVVLASTDLRAWTPTLEGTSKEDIVEYIDSEAYKFTCRFYRLLARTVFSTNVIGYASVSLPPGFSMIGNPFEGSPPVGELFKEWPDGTTVNRFDTQLFRLVENGVKQGKWINPAEKLVPGEGAIFFNPTSDYKSASFYGEVNPVHQSVPVPSGFSIRSSLVPERGNLAEDLKFPVTNGDVIHLFDRERQAYVLHPFENGQWTAGPPILGVGESFWVAKTEPGNWMRTLAFEDTAGR
jgi:hypothetical protein